MGVYLFILINCKAPYKTFLFWLQIFQKRFGVKMFNLWVYRELSNFPGQKYCVKLLSLFRFFYCCQCFFGVIIASGDI